MINNNVDQEVQYSNSISWIPVFITETSELQWKWDTSCQQLCVVLLAAGLVAM